jgi:hypothetical protein
MAEEETMAVTAPDWLTRHGGELRASQDAHSWMVVFGGDVQYVLIPVPAGGKFGCRITQTINGKRQDLPAPAPSLEEAVRAGLEVLRQGLGW